MKPRAEASGHAPHKNHRRTEHARRHANRCDCCCADPPVSTGGFLITTSTTPADATRVNEAASGSERTRTTKNHRRTSQPGQTCTPGDWLFAETLLLGAVGTTGTIACGIITPKKLSVFGRYFLWLLSCPGLQVTQSRCRPPARDYLTPVQFLALFIPNMHLTRIGGFHAGVVPEAERADSGW